MMGRLKSDQSQLFYEFRLGDAVPEDHMVRKISAEDAEGDQMPTFTAKPIERKCPACNGTGFPPVKQPKEQGRKIYPARCERCDGKGWVEAAN
jgi:DnaJ-class molecular chaperone